VHKPQRRASDPAELRSNVDRPPWRLHPTGQASQRHVIALEVQQHRVPAQAAHDVSRARHRVLYEISELETTRTSGTRRNVEAWKVCRNHGVPRLPVEQSSRQIHAVDGRLTFVDTRHLRARATRERENVRSPPAKTHAAALLLMRVLRRTTNGAFVSFGSAR
jgi:hypothetical protein